MTATGSKPYLDYLNKLVDKYNNIFHLLVGKKPIHADYSALTEKIETNPKATKLKIGGSATISKCQNNFSKG